jgi:uncharacterized protein YkwD
VNQRWRVLRSRLRLPLLVAVLLGCTATELRRLSEGAPLPGASADESRPDSAGSAARAPGEPWAPSSVSPMPAESGVAIPSCAGYEQSLLAAAGSVAGQAARQRAWDITDVITRMRAAGGPFVWPRVWTLQASSFDAPQARASLEAWLDQAPRLGQRRCGVLQSEASGGARVLAAVVVDALADLDPLPTRVRLGQWLRLRARLLVSTQTAETVLLGPHGAPRTIPTELRPAEVRSVFSLDQPGMWRIQLVLGTDSGPRPVVEAWAFVDEEPNARAAMMPAPGEASQAALPATESAQRSLLLAMLNAARRSEQRLPVRRDPGLDQLAQAHAEAMRRARQTAHDVGQGLPSERLRRAGFEVTLVGENVAYAGSLARAHRALWDSPSHRGTLLEPGFGRVGLGVASEDEAVWVCELFAN